MPPRVFVDAALVAGCTLVLPAGAARHVRVLRLQPGDALTLFDGSGGEWDTRIAGMARIEVTAELIAHRCDERELALAVTLAVAMPAGDRMDALVEKATELGVAAIQPLAAERSVLRLSGERAERRRAHWQAIAVAACEQCGRNRLPSVAPVQGFDAWLAALPPAAADETRWLLGWRDAAPWPHTAHRIGAGLTLLSGPEGGFTEAEETAARARGFASVTLGARVLRADTAPLAALAALALARA